MADGYPNYENEDERFLFEKAAHGTQDREIPAAKWEIERRKFNRWSSLQVNTKTFMAEEFKKLSTSITTAANTQKEAAKGLERATIVLAIATGALVLVAAADLILKHTAHS